MYAWVYSGLCLNLHRSSITGSIKTRYEEFRNVIPDFKTLVLLPFGLPVMYPPNPKSRKGKFAKRRIPGMYLGPSEVTPSSVVIYCPNSKRIVERRDFTPLWTLMPNGWTSIDRKFWTADLTAEELSELPSQVIASDGELSDTVSTSPSLLPSDFVKMPVPSVKKGNQGGALVLGKEIIDNGKVTVSDPIGTVKAPESSLTGISVQDEGSVPVPTESTVGSPPEVMSEAALIQNDQNLEVPSVPVLKTSRQCRRTKKPVRRFSPLVESVSLSDDIVLKVKVLKNIKSAAYLVVKMKGGIRVKVRVAKTESRRQLIAKLKKMGKKKNKKRAFDNPTLEQARNREDWPLWEKAIAAEIEQLEVDDDVFQFIKSLPPGSKAIPSMFVLQIKRLPDGKIDKYKARLVALGNHQTADQYNSISSPTARTSSVKMIIALQAKEDAASCVLDVKGAFLKSEIKAVDGLLYLRLPDGRLVKLKKYLYGLKQAGYEWFETLAAVMASNGYYRSNYDPSLYYRRVGKNYCIAAVHVDDFYCVASSDEELQRLQQVLQDAFGTITVKDDNVLSYLGMFVSVERDGSCSITQPGYLTKILEKSGIDLSSTASTPCADKWSIKPDDNELVDKTLYLERVGMLNYLAVLTRSDILYAVSKCAQRCSKPTKLDMRKVNRVFYYLNGTKDFGIRFKKGKVILVGWVDASHLQYKDGKGHFGYCFSLGLQDGAFYARSQKMKLLTPAGSTETEYVAMYEAATEIVFLRNLLSELGFPQRDATVLYEDNQSAIHMVNGRGSFQKSKHVNVKYHYTRDLIKKGLVNVVYCKTKDMRADILTKGLSKGKHVNCVKLLMCL
jgi:hypothetical protein